MTKTPSKPAPPSAAAPPQKGAPPPAAAGEASRIRQEGGRNVLQWAADTARMVALSTSQVLRKLDNSSLSIEDDSGIRGRPSRRSGPMPGGGVNPYESRGAQRKPARSREAHRGAAPTAVRAGAGLKSRSPAAGRERASWWSRLFRRG